MHSFSELTDRCVSFTLANLSEINERTAKALETSGATYLVKTLQMIQLQKTILVVGMFSIFESNLQEGLSCSDGFCEAKKILDSEQELEIKERFENLILAINTLKHGRGRSYNTLIAKSKKLPFRIKLPNESFFEEGDVSEVLTLIEVDDAFVHYCADVIGDVSSVIRRLHIGFY